MYIHTNSGKRKFAQVNFYTLERKNKGKTVCAPVVNVVTIPTYQFIYTAKNE